MSFAVAGGGLIGSRMILVVRELGVVEPEEMDMDVGSLRPDLRDLGASLSLFSADEEVLAVVTNVVVVVDNKDSDDEEGDDDDEDDEMVAAAATAAAAARFSSPNILVLASM